MKTKSIIETMSKDHSCSKERKNESPRFSNDDQCKQPVDLMDFSDPQRVNEQLLSLVTSTLTLYGCTINEEPMTQNILRVLSADKKKGYILYFFYSYGNDSEWYADENKFQGEDPLWFSASSHIVSPVYSAYKCAKKRSTSQITYQPIVVLMYPCSIINPDEVISVWEQRNVKVITIERLFNLQDVDMTLVDTFETLIEDISFQSRYSQEVDEDVLCEDSGEVKISRVRFGIERTQDDRKRMVPSISTCFKAVDDGVLYCWVDVEGDPMPDAYYSFEIRDSEGMTVLSEDEPLTEKPDQIVFIPILDLLSGEYWFYIKRNDKILYKKLLTFVDIKDECDSFIKLGNLRLFRIDSSDTDINYNTLIKKGSLSCFNIEDLSGILIVALLKKDSDVELPCQFVILIENEAGEVVYEVEEDGMFDLDNDCILSHELRDIVSSRGAYTIKVKFLEDVVLEKDFVIGQRDLKTNNNSVQLVKPVKENFIIKRQEEDPLKELQSMIGLGSLKEQLLELIAKIKLDKLRKECGLPIKAQQLHMAFLGNPGTGKTTVAKLLGKIYKENGMLSKGHLVMEDRSTLMTSSWGGEGELVNLALEKARGGILFIDEAYDLITEHKSDPGKLIISSLLQAMADENKRDFMVIFSGYTAPMELLLNKNQGLRSRLSLMYFEDYKVCELMQIADLWLQNNCYELTDDARAHLNLIVEAAWQRRDVNFGNARYIVNLLENEVQPAMAKRVMSLENIDVDTSLLKIIEACDMPNYNAEKGNVKDVIAQLNSMVGLEDLKTQIHKHLSLVRFNQQRRDNKILTSIPPMHMIFTGNPGTGKTSVAAYLGEIYHSMGILSIGNVINVTRVDMIGQHIGETEANMRKILTVARGNILFIDEAYTLFSESENDFGKNAVEALLDMLGKENADMIVIMAGYPKEMDELLNTNPGLRDRFPYVFSFKDYNEDELFEIAQGVIKDHSLKLTDQAALALRAIIRKECRNKNSNFSNARFIVRLITTKVIPNMASRLDGETDPEKLSCIHSQDIPIDDKEIKMINENLFDEQAIESAFSRLDAMVGLTNVKTAIHQFVDFVRSVNRTDPRQIERYPLKWSFVGNTGTGKSSVAKILLELLRAMHLVGEGDMVEIRAEELYGLSASKVDELIQQRMKESNQGLLFFDGDAQQFRTSDFNYNLSNLKMSLTTNIDQIIGRFAVVIAEHESPQVSLAKSLDRLGISNFNHTLIFDDYTADELMEILTAQLFKHGVELSANAAAIMSGYIKQLCVDSVSGGNANARTMKELSRMIRNMTASLVSDSKVIIVPEEMVAKFSMIESRYTKIGY